MVYSFDMKRKFFLRIGNQILITIAIYAMMVDASTPLEVHNEHFTQSCEIKRASSTQLLKLLEPRRMPSSICKTKQLKLRGGSEEEENTIDLSGDGGVLKRIFRQVSNVKAFYVT